MEKKFYVYIMSNKRNGTLYTGMTSDIHRRLETHKNKLLNGFTQKYELTKLVFIEMHDEPGSAIAREKELRSGIEAGS
jgi:putative endonuclease